MIAPRAPAVGICAPGRSPSAIGASNMNHQSGTRPPLPPRSRACPRDRTAGRQQPCAERRHIVRVSNRSKSQPFQRRRTTGQPPCSRRGRTRRSTDVVDMLASSCSGAMWSPDGCTRGAGVLAFAGLLRLGPRTPAAWRLCPGFKGRELFAPGTSLRGRTRRYGSTIRSRAGPLSPAHVGVPGRRRRGDDQQRDRLLVVVPDRPRERRRDPHERAPQAPDGPRPRPPSRRRPRGR